MRQRLATGGQRTLPPSGDPRARDCRKRTIDHTKTHFRLAATPRGVNPPGPAPRASQPLIILRKEITSPHPPATRLSSSAEGANHRKYHPRDQNSCGLQTSQALENSSARRRPRHKRLPRPPPRLHPTDENRKNLR